MATLTKLQENVEALIPQVEALLDNKQLDEYQVRAVEYLKKRLADIHHEAKNGVLEQVTDRKGEMARVVAELDPHVLDPALGGALMKIEAEYYGTQ